MYRVNVDVQVPPALQTWVKEDNYQTLLATIANAARELTIANFKRLGTQERYNVGFYAKHGVSKTHAITRGKDSAELLVDDYIMEHKLLGGQEFPVRGMYLAIPLTEEAKRALNPRSFKRKLFFVHSNKTGSHFLAEKQGKNRDLKVHFALCESVIHKPHPDTIPSTTAMVNKGIEIVDETLRLQGAYK